MTVTKEHKGLMQRVGIDLCAVFLFGIFLIWNTGSFKTHVNDFEIATNISLAKLELRVDNIEGRERELISVISKLSTNTERLYQDISRLENRIDTLLKILNEG